MPLPKVGVRHSPKPVADNAVTLVLEKRKPFDELAKRLEIQLSRDDCRSFEPWTMVRDTYATSFFSPRPWYLSELAAIADEMT